jgi:hypothetical protein
MKLIGSDMELKKKIIRDREKHVEKKSFEERRSNLEEFFKTSVEIMLENKKMILSIQERENLKTLDRKCYRELKYEMDSFIWTLLNFQIL